MAEKQLKSEEELHVLLREAAQNEPFPLQDFQWIKIVAADPAVHGANWTVAHSGKGIGHGQAIDAAQAKLKRLYDLRLVGPSTT